MRNRTDTDVRNRNDTDIRNSGNTNVRNRTDVDVRNRTDIDVRNRTTNRYTADWAANRSREDVRSVQNSLSSAFANNRARDGGDWDNWRDREPDRFRNWDRWGSNVRSSYRGGSPYYTSNWWSGRNVVGLGLGNFTVGYGNNNWWGYQPWNTNYNSGYWWGRPQWSSFLTWFPNYGWQQPYYYDYGPSGNVVYRNDQVYVSGQYVGTPAQYATSAAELAYIDPNAIEPTPADGWKPLGTFSVAINEDEQNPPRVMQLAINKDGVVSGTIFNRTSDKLYTVQGRVDDSTQRVAFTIGNDPNVVLETGIYNLTLDETPLLVHFGENKTATYLLVRLDEPAAQQAASPGEEALR